MLNLSPFAKTPGVSPWVSEVFSLRRDSAPDEAGEKIPLALASGASFQQLRSMTKKGYLYILGNQKPVLYVGVTADLRKRIYQHKHKFGSDFTKKYDIHKLLYYEVFDRIWDAIKREKQIKNWRRDWKINLIRSINPNLEDLSAKVLE